MRTLVYGFTLSLDGYINDRAGLIDWTSPDDELHQFHNDRYRALELSLHGRRLYELMAAHWPYVTADAPPIQREFARLWTEKPKVVFSRTLTDVGWNSTLVSENAVEEVRRLKAAGDGVMEVGGANLAAALIPHGLVDEYQVFLAPVILGGGTPFLPALDQRITLRVAETRHFDTVEMLRYVTG
ncbi:dihydrofolate reductase [Nocardia yunnanensis]|uniref:Dihydrofolate reductase n=1 Tax=Nocardia yunnanensis TaxID=2382165 RepID=A0A386ZDX2_9NOCA|nr:dihydrofolate reductase family protein [Nocardia yunnanensis]AYF75688.1 dihydrofolate reductase [Nocardia yunnanensis]